MSDYEWKTGLSHKENLSRRQGQKYRQRVREGLVAGPDRMEAVRENLRAMEARQLADWEARFGKKEPT